MQRKTRKRIFIGIGLVGLALLVMMITTEGEPGALPLALLLVGAVGFFWP